MTARVAVLVLAVVVCACHAAPFFGKQQKPNKIGAANTPIQQMFLAMTLAWNQQDCSTVVSYLTPNVQILQNGRVQTGSNVFMNLCTSWAQSPYTVATVDVSESNDNTHALWHKSFTVSNSSHIQYNKFTHVGITGPLHDPSISFMEFFWEMHEADDAISNTLTNSYSVQYSMNCAKWLNFYSTACNWVYPTNFFSQPQLLATNYNYQQMQQTCPQLWQGMDVFMWAGMWTVMTNNVRNSPNPDMPNKYLIAWNQMAHNATTSFQPYTMNSGYGIYQLDNNNLIVNSVIYLIADFS
jgi:hypothetical protein